MRRILSLIAPLLLLCGCASNISNPYSGVLCSLDITVSYPEGYSSREGALVTVENVGIGNTYCLGTDASGKVNFELPGGLYRVGVSDVSDEDIFNGSVNNVVLTGPQSLSVEVLHSRAGAIVFKEIYCGGCMKTPMQGTYNFDQYIILHNNNSETEYLDGLCFGSLSPYNSNSANRFLSPDPNTGEMVLPEYVPIAQSVWRFGGDGHSFPLEPGEDAVVAVLGAIDHSASYPLSVNLNKEGYFVCYNPTYFTNTSYHPAPGTNITGDRWLEVVVKTGKANAYTFSINSPAAVIFRAPEGVSLEDFLNREGNIRLVPGATDDKVACIPPEWVMDAVEVFNGSSSSNTKRLLPSLDAGYVTLSETHLGHSLVRSVNTGFSEAVGYEVLNDSNNSSADFYESTTQSLHEKK